MYPNQIRIVRLLWLLAFSNLYTVFIYAQQKHIYIACDNHTDYLWATTEEEYRITGLNEVDYYLDLADATQGLASPFQSRYNLDCAWYVYNYQQNRTPAQFARLINRIKSGHISVPLNWFVSTYGGQTTEAILRGMYWSGELERKYGIDIDLAVSMENISQPIGLASLWAGAGAKYSWKGVCGCTSTVELEKLNTREHEIYRWNGPDNTGLLMKWNALTFGSNLLGGYAEARRPSVGVNQGIDLCNTPSYPYNIAGVFGAGWDDVEWLTDSFPLVAQNRTTSDVKVYVSNEEDFFEHFEQEYGSNIPSENVSYGNDWDVSCATLAPITAKIRKSVEKLRNAEALASVASLVQPDFYAPDDAEREQAWIALGSYWEHNFALGGCCYHLRNDWYIGLQEKVTKYADSLHQRALKVLATNIPNASTNTRFFVFNALSWQRTDFADVIYDGSAAIKVIDIQTGQETPHQIITTDGVRYLRILAKNIPSVGYKVFEIQAGISAPSMNTATLNGAVFENPFYKLTVTSEGVITSLLDKLNGNQEFVKVTNGRYVNDFGQGARQNGNLTLVNNGSVSATIACTSALPLQHTTYITLFKEINRIDIKNVINDTYGNDIRTYSFSFDLNNPTLWHEELGAILKAKYAKDGGHYANPDQPVRHWWQTLNHFGDIGSNTKGIILSNEGAAFMKLGNSNDTLLDQNSAQINVLIGGLMYDLNNDLIYNQYNIKEFINSFAIRTRSQAFDAATSMRFALEHQNPLTSSMIVKSQPTSENNCHTLPANTFSMVQINNPKVLLWTLKPSEEGLENGGLIARVWNFDTIPQTTTIDFAAEATSAYQVTHIETDIETVPLSQGNLVSEIGQQRLESFRILVDAATSTAPSDTTINASICAGGQYLGYTQNGTYTDVFTNSVGCDSIRIIHLTVLPKSDTTKVTAYTCAANEAGTRWINLTNQAGCDSIVEVNTRFLPFEYNIQKVDAACPTARNGQIRITGVNNYIYNWSNGAQGATLMNLPTGTYMVTITNPTSGCAQSTSVTIQAGASSVRVTVLGQDNYCAGGYVNAVVRGGIPPYTYQWNTTDTSALVLGIDAGNYIVTVTDSIGCQAFGEIALADYDSLVVNTTEEDASCFDAEDGRIEVRAAGGVPPYQVNWSNGASGLVLENLAAGTYLMTLSDSKLCSITKTITIQSPSQVIVNLQVQQPASDSLKGRASVAPIGGQQPYRIRWSTGASSNQISNLEPGAYAVTVTDGNECEVVTNFTILPGTSGSENIPSLVAFKAYPNPASDQLNIELQFYQAEQGKLILMDISGKQIFQEAFSGNNYRSVIPVALFAKGTYIVQAIVGVQKVEKLITVQ